MQLRRLGGLALAAALTATIPTAAAFAQSSDNGSKRDVKKAGTETKDAAKDAGTSVKKGTKKVYHKTKHGTKKVLHKINGNPDTPANNPSH